MGTGTVAMRPRRRAAVLRRLDAEWTALAEDAAVRARCGGWSACGVLPPGCQGVGDVLDAVARAPDAVLHALLVLAVEGDRLAGRLVLQALLPKVVRMAAVDPVAELDDYVAALWFRIATYPVDRRPTSVAGNLALDTLKSVRRERGSAADVVTSPDTVLLAADRHPTQVVGARPGRAGPSAIGVLDRARRLRLVDARTSALLLSVYAEGLSGAAAGDRHGLSPGAVRVRCSRALKVLAQHADLLAG